MPGNTKHGKRSGALKTQGTEALVQGAGQLDEGLGRLVQGSFRLDQGVQEMKGQVPTLRREWNSCPWGQRI